MTHVAAAVEKIGGFTAPVQFNSVTRGYFSELAPLSGCKDTGKWMRALDAADRGEHAARFVSDADPMWNAMLHDTVAPTMLQAGIRQNVVPSEARAVLNVKLGCTEQLRRATARQKLRKRSLPNDPQDPDSRSRTGAGRGSTIVVAQLGLVRFGSAEVYATALTFPGLSVPAAMHICTSATDSLYLRLRSVRIPYGVLPFALTDDDFLRMHADDERIPIDSFRKGIDFLYGIVSDFAGAK